MDMQYWIWEYGKVLCGYLFLMFLWPSVVFNRHLKKKSMVYRFGFCVTVPIMIINTVVLTLGFFHILNSWIVRLLFGGIFFAEVVRNIVRHVKHKNGKADFAEFLKTHISHNKCNAAVMVFAKKYSLLIVIIIYGVLYFSYGGFQVHSYGYGDLYVHHAWIYGLMEGDIFAGGVYPEAMHCLIYCMNTLLGIRVYSILLFLQSIHMAVFLISAYLLFRQVFYWKYTPLFVLTLFLTLDLSNADLVHSMFRLQITMPMEFGLYTVFLGALYLIKYLNGKQENLFLFAMALAVSTATHFHVLIMMVIVCASFAAPALKKVLNLKYLLPLILASGSACLIAAAPMTGALMEGIPFNDSIRWAVSSMDGNESIELRNPGSSVNNAKALSTKKDGESTMVFTRRLLFNIYNKGYAALYGNERAGWIVFFTVIISGLCLFVRKESGLRGIGKICEGYPPVILTSVFYSLVYAAPMIGWPDLIPEGRFFAIGHMMLLAVMAMMADVCFSVLAMIGREAVVQTASFLAVAGIYGSALLFGNIHGYLFYELTRYNAAVMVTESIINTYPRQSYTIVSPTDELYQVIEYGWHEELISFVESSGSMGYTLPSKYVFIYVEKKPILYAQAHFFSGPAWLGEEKYLEPYWMTYFRKYPDNGASQSPGIIASQISKTAAEQDMLEYDNQWVMYSRLENRSALESKAYAWCERFAKRYPDTLKTYYEDEEFVCFYFEQDLSGTLYDLGIE